MSSPATPAPAPEAPQPFASDTTDRATRAGFDPYAAAPPASAWRYLVHLNPLTKVAAVVPAMIVLIFVRDLATPAIFLALAYALIITGARLTWRVALVLFIAIPAFMALIGVGFSLWTDPSRVSHDVVALQIGDWRLYGGQFAVGFATALRLGAITSLALIGGLTTTGPDLARSLVQQLRVPYRIGYAALAAFRFVPRFAHELDIIRAAHRVRGASRGRGPVAAVTRRLGYVIPLLAGGIRHAERVALAMDARAFGAHRTRTERYLVPFRSRDVVFILGFWAASAAILWLNFPWEA